MVSDDFADVDYEGEGVIKSLGNVLVEALANSPDKAIAESGLLSELCYPRFHKLHIDYSLTIRGYLQQI